MTEGVMRFALGVGDDLRFAIRVDVCDGREGGARSMPTALRVVVMVIKQVGSRNSERGSEEAGNRAKRIRRQAQRICLGCHRREHERRSGGSFPTFGDDFLRRMERSRQVKPGLVDLATCPSSASVAAGSKATVRCVRLSTGAPLGVRVSSTSMRKEHLDHVVNLVLHVARLVWRNVDLLAAARCAARRRLSRVSNCSWTR